jgi:hypothetical protein
MQYSYDIVRRSRTCSSVIGQKVSSHAANLMLLRTLCCAVDERSPSNGLSTTAITAVNEHTYHTPAIRYLLVLCNILFEQG